MPRRNRYETRIDYTRMAPDVESKLRGIINELVSTACQIEIEERSAAQPNGVIGLGGPVTSGPSAERIEHGIVQGKE
jgi:hypothetical protein